jgi:hypothetical protein
MGTSTARLMPQLGAERGDVRDSRVNEAAQLLLQAVVAEGKFRRAGREFLNVAKDIDQRRIIRRAADLLNERYPSAPADRALEVAWRDARRLFGWVDVADLEPRGQA